MSILGRMFGSSEGSKTFDWVNEFPEPWTKVETAPEGLSFFIDEPSCCRFKESTYWKMRIQAAEHTFKEWLCSIAPDDDVIIVFESFTTENGRRVQDNSLFEMPIDSFPGLAEAVKHARTFGAIMSASGNHEKIPPRYVFYALSLFEKK